MSTESQSMVLVTDVPFWRGEAGAHRRVAGMCSALLAEGHRIDVFYPTHLNREDHARFRERHPDLSLHIPPLPLLALRLLRSRLGARGPLLWERRRALRTLCMRLRPQHVMCVYLHTAPMLSGLRESLPFPVKTLIDTIDVQHLRGASMQVPAAITRDEEAEALLPFDAILAIQETEAQEFRAMCPDAKVIVTGHTHPIHQPQPKTARPIRLLFIAAEGAHNRSAIEGFLDSVWPELRESHRESIELQIAGHVCQHLTSRTLPEGVVTLGFVEDLDALYADAHIAVNPLYAGSGLKIKNVEALCHSLPLVTTSVGAQGMESGAGEAFVVCDSPTAMREELDRLIRDQAARERLAAAAHTYAQAQFSTDAAYRALLDYMRGGS